MLKINICWCIGHMMHLRHSNRPIEMSIIDYINEFEWLYNQIKRYDMELPAGVLAYQVLKNANCSSEKLQLARAILTSLTWKYEKATEGPIW